MFQKADVLVILDDPRFDGPPYQPGDVVKGVVEVTCTSDVT